MKQGSRPIHQVAVSNHHVPVFNAGRFEATIHRPASRSKWVSGRGNPSSVWAADLYIFQMPGLMVLSESLSEMLALCPS
jgi:hypothetical protein